MKEELLLFLSFSDEARLRNLIRPAMRTMQSDYALALISLVEDSSLRSE